MPGPDRIFVTGASGLLGTKLCAQLARDAHPVVAISRQGQPGRSAPGVSWITGDITQPGPWFKEIDGARAVVHLAGEPVAAGRWSDARKRSMVRSRVESTLRIAEAIEYAQVKPSVLVCASATGYYGSRGDRELLETAGPGNDFLSQLCVDWEESARAVEAAGVRVVSLRFGVVLSRDGGALARMLPIFRLGVGGPLGPADRWFPWIHESDAVGLIDFALNDDKAALSGVVNAVSPGAVRMGEFAKTLGRVLKRPAFLPVPLRALRMALGEAGEALVPGQHVVPQKAIAAGFKYRFPNLERALLDLV
jgi:uncharacterized protein (TIGR01777 family)